MLDHSQIHFQKFTKKGKKIPIMKTCDPYPRVHRNLEIRIKESTHRWYIIGNAFDKKY